MRSIRPLLAIGLFALPLACSQGEPPLAVMANAPNTFEVGQAQRVLVGLVDAKTSDFLASPDLAASGRFTAPDGAVIETEAEFLWTVPDVIGIYKLNTTFDQAGTWWVELFADGLPGSTQASFIVGGNDLMPGIGEAAVSVETKTSADYPLEELSSDPDPDPSFYELSLDQALTNGQPTVLVFASPAFCTSQTCGPMLDQVEEVAPSHPGANFVHVEVWDNIAEAADGAELTLSPAVSAWKLPSEPWIFVIDGSGNVAARFEGAMLTEELDQALQALGA